MDMQSRVIPQDTGFQFNDHRRFPFTGAVQDDVKPERPDAERFPPDTMFGLDEITEREMYAQSRGGAGLVSVLIIVALSWVYGAMCGYGLCLLVN